MQSDDLLIKMKKLLVITKKLNGILKKLEKISLKTNLDTEEAIQSLGRVLQISNDRDDQRGQITPQNP